MANVKIVTDSLADIPAHLAKELEITQVPCTVRFGDEEFRDRVDLLPTEFYQRLVASPILPTTSQPSVGAFEQAYRQVALKSNEIVSIHVIGDLSGTLNAARLAAKNLPDLKIELVDSRQISMGMGWLAIIAARAAKAGRTLAEIRALVEDTIPRVHIIGMLDTLQYAQRGGRLGKGQALVGTLLNVKPLLSVVRGEIVPVENVRTLKRALERLVEITLTSGPIQDLAVIHAAAPHYADQLHQVLAETFPEDHILMSETGPVLGTHTGPGSVGIAWVTGKY
ncbi:MAG: DegV family protein [Chloroflexi bacterium]|nr:DegV family protein [Chloroflexota bacterium]